MLITGELVVVCTLCCLTYPTVFVYGFQAFHGHVSDVASPEEDLSCWEMKTIIINTPCIHQHLHSQIHQHSLQGFKVKRETFGNVPSCFMAILSDVGRPQAWNLPKQRLWPIKQYQEMNTNETLKFYDSYPAELKACTVVPFCWM